MLKITFVVSKNMKLVCNQAASFLSLLAVVQFPTVYWPADQMLTLILVSYVAMKIIVGASLNSSAAEQLHHQHNNCITVIRC